MTPDPKTISPDSISNRNGQNAGEPNPSLSNSGQEPPAKRGIWLLRIRALLLVTLCATFGVLLIILPWTPRWTDNPALLGWPTLRTMISSGFFRGLCSGLGIVDLWLGFWEAIHYHEAPR